MRRHPSRMVRPIGVALACAALGLVAAAPAGAYLRDFQTFQGQGTPSSDPVRTTITGCPTGRSILGAGASAFASSGVDISGVGLTRMHPIPAAPPRSFLGTNASIGAVEAEPTVGSWSLFTQVQCATRTDTAPTEATNGPYVKDVFIASTATAFDSTSPKQVSTACQGGRRSIGGGFRIQTTSGRPAKMAIRRAVRIDGGFVVNAHETVPTSASWHVIAFAVCANLGNVGARLANYAIPASDTDTVSVADVNRDFKTAFAQCPAGQFPIGGGGQVLGHTAGTAPPGDVVLVGSWPYREARGWFVEAAEETPTPRNWRVAARVICAGARQM